ncbi:hypothetical protein [Microlunatus ginsengisoli]|uniref:Uncharacterized protein n=1 Tax=Microlunatus ginsengisoli TaxID=363863 RepID=A0ABP7AL90_9ACTN
MDPLLAYLTTTCDPLTGLVRRVEVERAAVAALADDPVRTCVWFAAMIGPFVRALPAGDPWTSVSARLPNGLTAGPQPPPGPAAVSPSGGFGTVEDHLDLVPRGADDIGDDLQLAGIAAPLPLPAAYLIASAGGGAGLPELAAACLAVRGLSEADGGFDVPPIWAGLVAPGRPDSAPGGFHLLSSALRMVLARYRTYVGDGAVSAEAPQLAIELDAWLASRDLAGVDPSAPPARLRDDLAGALAPVRRQQRTDIAWAGREAEVAVDDLEPAVEPPLRSTPIPAGSYDDFRLT